MTFILYDLIPFLIFSTTIKLSTTISYVIICSTIVHLFMFIKYHKLNFTKIEIFIPNTYKQYNRKRKVIICLCLLILLAIGTYTGVLGGLIRGNDIEGLRRTSEIGIGVIRDIPILIVFLLSISLMLQAKKEEWIKIMFYLGSVK